MAKLVLLGTYQNSGLTWVNLVKKVFFAILNNLVFLLRNCFFHIQNKQNDKDVKNDGLPVLGKQN